MTTAADALTADVAAGAISTDNPAVADVTLDDFILDGRPMDANVRNAVDDIAINRAIDGASTLTVGIDDPKGELLNSPVLAKAVDVWLDDLAFRLADLDLVDDDGGLGLTSVFEARAVAKLRLFRKPMAASRADKTRAEFIKAMCDEADVPFVCPQLHKSQTIETKTDRKSRKARDANRDPGFKAGARLEVAGTKLDSAQVANANRALDVAESVKANTLATLALLEACIVEPGGFQGSGPFDNPAGGDSTSQGILQLLSSTASGLGISARDVEACCHAFLTKGFWGKGGAIAIAKAHPDWTPGQVAQNVQGSAFPARYEVYRDDAEAILKAYNGGDLSSFAGGATKEYAVTYMFRRGPADGSTTEDSWTCMRRLADEVNWRLWEDAGTVYFMTDDDILRSRVRHTITPGAEGVDSVTGRISTRKPLQEVTVQCHARRWQAPPATVCEIEGYGKFDGRWIVATINRPSVFATATTVTLHRRQAVKLEPAHDTRTVNQAAANQGGAADVPGGGVIFPLAKRGKLIGTPYTGTHAKAFNVAGGSDNWESENAVDIGVTRGTAVFAVDDGTIGPSIGSLGSGGRFAGERLHVVTRTNEWYYAHLSRIDVKAGDRVKASQRLGLSGTANGVDHLHLACKDGNPSSLIYGAKSSPSSVNAPGSGRVAGGGRTEST